MMCNDMRMVRFGNQVSCAIQEAWLAVVVRGIAEMGSTVSSGPKAPCLSNWWSSKEGKWVKTEGKGAKFDPQREWATNASRKNLHAKTRKTSPCDACELGVCNL